MARGNRTLSFVIFLAEIISERLQRYVGAFGGAEQLFFMGSKETQYIVGEFRFSEHGYRFKLAVNRRNELFFSNEQFDLNDNDGRRWVTLDVGHRESMLQERYLQAKVIQVRNCLSETVVQVSGIMVYHFHDTSDSADVKKLHPITDNVFLRYDAQNWLRSCIICRRPILRFMKKFAIRCGWWRRFLAISCCGLIFKIRIRFSWSGRRRTRIFRFMAATMGWDAAVYLFGGGAAAALAAQDVASGSRMGLHPYALTILSTLIYAAARMHS